MLNFAMGNSGLLNFVRREAKFETVWKQYLQIPGNDGGKKAPEYIFLNVAEALHEKVRVYKPNILQVVTDENDPRNKVMLMRDGKEYTSMKYTLMELHEIIPHLLQPNHSELLAIDRIVGIGHDHRTLTVLDKNEKKEQ